MKKLRKSNDKIIFGVLGGIAEYFDMDPTVVRLIYVALSVTLIGSPILAYLLMALVMPESK